MLREKCQLRTDAVSWNIVRVGLESSASMHKDYCEVRTLIWGQGASADLCRSPLTFGG